MEQHGGSVKGTGQEAQQPGPECQDGTVGHEVHPVRPSDGGPVPIVGELVPPGLMLRFQEHCRSVSPEGDRAYKAGLLGEPQNGTIVTTGVMVRASMTGQAYVLRWPDIFALALFAGIDTMAAPPGAKVPPPATARRPRLILPGG